MRKITYTCLGLATALASAQAARAQAAPATAQPDASIASGVPPTRTTAASDTSSAAGGQNNGEIVVTAQKRSETLTSVPMSISAIGGDKLKQAGVSNVADLTKIVPGFSFQPSDYGSPILTLRGVGLRNVAIAVSPTVSVYLDQVPLPFSEMTRGASLDLERVEVLKGPQGTLFGQNSTGGAINYIAAKPTHDVQGGASLTYGRFNEVDGDVMLSGPLSDTVRARVAVRTEQRDGWQKSLTRDDTLGSRNFTTGRLLLDWDPSASLSLSLNINGWLDKSETPASQFLEYAPQIPDGRQTLVPYLSSLARAPDKARWADWDPGVDFHRNDHMIQTALRADWTIAPETTVTSITSYASFRQRSPIDNDGTAVNDLRLSIHGDIDTVSQELRVSGTAFGGGLKWVVGGNYESDITRDEQSGRFMGTNATGAGIDFDEFSNINHSNIKSYAAFASLDYAITPKLLLQGSARYTRSIIDFRGCLADDGTGSLATSFSLISGTTIAPGACVTLDPVTFKPVPIVTNALKEDNAPWRAGISYRPTSGSNYYFNVTRGYKAGSFPTVPGFFPAQFAPVKQESVLAYEIGFKQSFLQGKLRVSGAAFYYDYSDKQILGYILTAFGNMPALISIPRSDIKGAEIQIDARPIRGWTVSAGASYIKSRVRSNFIGNDPLANPINFKGEEFPGSPKWQASVDTQYDFALTSDVKAFLGGTLSYRSATQAAFGNLAISRLNGYALLDLRAGLEAGKWRLQIYGHNVTNKFYVNNIGRSEDAFSRTVGMPATYGVTVSRKF